MARRKLGIILALAVAHVVLTLWQVLAGRDDWPLSRFPMYSELKGPWVERFSVVGVTEHGEFLLSDEQSAPFKGARLSTINHRLEGDPERQRRFLQELGKKYERKRERAGWPALQALRSYTESWWIRPQLEGMNRPKRTLTRATYLPPLALRKQLELEGKGSAPPPEAMTSPPGDLVFDLGAEHCDAGCARLSDPQASSAAAVELRPETGVPAACSLHVPIAAGRWALFVRLKTAAAPGSDSLTLEVDGESPATGSVVGGHREYLPAEGWVWVSAAPGHPALLLELGVSGEHTLTFHASTRVAVDQVWLSRSARELPIDNRIRAP